MNPRLINEAPDGNCLFRTFSRKLYDNPERYDEVRRKICVYLLDNFPVWQNFIEKTNDEQLYEYVYYMSVDYTWGGHIEIIAFINLFGCSVVVHEPNKPPLLQEPNRIGNNVLSEDDIIDGRRKLENQILHIFRSNDHYQTLIFDNSYYTKRFT
jgi:hypothetical protein